MIAFSDGAAPRLKAGVWVGAYVRRCAVSGAFAAISRRGDDSAGAIFIECFHRDGADLYGPRTGEDGARTFERLLSGVPEREVAERVAREAAFDGDLWLVTVEDPAGRTFFLDDEHE